MAGYQAELEFERRAMDLGYSPIMRPSRLDDGVDFVLWTTRGWAGVQVKCQQEKFEQRKGKGRPRVYYNFSTRSLPIKVGGKWVRHKSGKSYYASRGVSVFAIYNGRGFYVVPIEKVPGEGETRLTSLGWAWEAWEAVLGAPARSIREQADPVESADPLEQMALLPERGPAR